MNTPAVGLDRKEMVIGLAYNPSTEALVLPDPERTQLLAELILNGANPLFALARVLTSNCPVQVHA